MKRRFLIAALGLAAVTVPALVMTVFLFGCCVLPFHNVVHNAMPFCGGFIKALTHEAAPEATPEARPPKAPVKVAIGGPAIMAPPIAIIPRDGGSMRSAISLHKSIRSFVSLGALRCDDDVGLHLLFATFLI